MLLINLKEITEEGREFVFGEESKDLRNALRDLVGDLPIRARVFLRKLNGFSFEMRGAIETKTKEQCSRCAEDFDWEIHEKFKELMVPGTDLPRDGKSSKVNHFSELDTAQPQVLEYTSEEFNLGEYLHEVVGLACPFNPAPPVDEKGSCSACHISLQNQNFNYDEDFEHVQSPFSVLKNIKLN